MRLLVLLLIANFAWAADNTIVIDQIGSNNTYTISQDGTGHTATVTTGRVSDVDYLTLSIAQSGTGAKTATVEVKSGINNGIAITQDGAGNHTASIQNLQGSANSITISQSGAGSHEFNVINTAGTINSNNTITATQSGGTGADKWFNVWLNGATGATVNVTQTSSTANQASMSVNCAAGSCGTWSYTRQ
jgi:hypothetical protein